MKQGISVILLAGGSGSRMQSSVPKQFLTLGSKPIARYSFDLFMSMPEIDEIIVVCSPESRGLFIAENSKLNLETAVQDGKVVRDFDVESLAAGSNHSQKVKAPPAVSGYGSKDCVNLPSSTAVSRLKRVSFALPGNRRQDSVYHGLQATSYHLICIHDAARPFIDKALVLRALEAGSQCGAAAVGLPLKFTIKEIDSAHFVQQTPDRSKMWEIQTPQVLHREILAKGFEHAYQHQLTVTDDVSLAELIQKPVKLVEGSPLNIKVTVPTDLPIAQHLLNLETAVQDGKVMQDFELEPLTAGGGHSQKVKAPPVVSGYGSKDCVNLPSSTDVSKLNSNFT